MSAQTEGFTAVLSAFLDALTVAAGAICARLAADAAARAGDERHVTLEPPHAERELHHPPPISLGIMSNIAWVKEICRPCGRTGVAGQSPSPSGRAGWGLTRMAFVV